MGTLLEKCTLLATPGTQFRPENADGTRKYLYEFLTVLDFKASALMTFDGILIAAAAFAVEKLGVVNAQRVLTLLVIFMALIAAGLCLYVARVSYPFLGKVVMTPATPGPPPTPGTLDYSQELEALADAVTKRTKAYQIAWWLSVGAVGLFMLSWFTNPPTGTPTNTPTCTPSVTPANTPTLTPTSTATERIVPSAA
jgi:hypothetical protein